MIPGTQEAGSSQTNLDRVADTRNDKAEALRHHEQSLAAFKTMKEQPEGMVPVLTQRVWELGKK